MKRLQRAAAVAARKLASAIVIFAMAAVLAAGMTYAATIWRNTGWIEDGQPITAQKMRDNFEYLYWRLEHPFPCSPNASSTVRVSDIGVLELCNGSGWVDATSATGGGADCVVSDSYDDSDGETESYEHMEIKRDGRCSRNERLNHPSLEQCIDGTFKMLVDKICTPS